MSLHVGDFIKMKVGEIALSSLEERLIVEEYIGQLYLGLAESEEGSQLLRKVERNLLHDLENVLLRFDTPKKWRDYVKATFERKREDKGGSHFGKLIKGNSLLLPINENSLPDGHPVKKAMQEARNSVLERIEKSERFDAEELKKWGNLLDEVEKKICIAATREWLCLSLRRVFDEPARQTTN